MSTLGVAAVFWKLLVPVRLAVVSMPSRSSSNRAVGAVVAAAGEEAKAVKSSSPPSSSSNLNSFSAGAGAGAGLADKVDDVANGRLGLGTGFAGLATTRGGEAWSLCTTDDIFSFDIFDADITIRQIKTF